MKNIERIREGSASEIANEFRRYAESPIRAYIDLESWLLSDSPEYIIPGKEVIWHDKTYIKVSDCTMMGAPYVTIVSPSGELYKVPKGEIHD